MNKFLKLKESSYLIYILLYLYKTEKSMEIVDDTYIWC